MIHITPKVIRPASTTRPMERATTAQVLITQPGASENGSNACLKRSSRPSQRSTNAVQRDCGCEFGTMTCDPRIDAAGACPAHAEFARQHRLLVDCRRIVVHEGAANSL